jgi:flagellin-like hook-associated protein FlgL
MALSINTNVAALNAYRNLNTTQNDLSKSLEKLSSGFRINRAADDAAGLAISEGMRSQIGGVKMGIRNAQDGISVVQTAEGALNETHSILQRMRDLSVQSANSGSLNDEAKSNIQTEIGQLNSELTRIADTTTFNGKKLLAGEYKGNFQVGANVGETISVDLTKTAKGLGAEGLGVDGIDVSADNAGTKGVTGGTSTAGTAATAAVTGTKSTYSMAFANDAAVAAWVGASGSERTDFEVNGEAVDLEDVTTLDGLASAIASVSAANVTAVATTTGITITAAANGDEAVEVEVASADAGGTSVVGTDDTALSAGTKSGYTATLDLSDLSGIVSLGDKSLDLGSVLSGLADDATDADKATALQSALVEKFGAGQTVGSDGALSLTAAAVGTDEFSVKGLTGAEDAIAKIDEAIKTVSTTRSDLGAVQNRFEHTINNLNVAVENMSASESRIRDTDMAAESLSFTRSQILSQAGTAMLAQAKSVPQGVLQLLQ